MPLRDAAIAAGIITGVWVVAGSELLSLVKGLSFWPLLLWWSIPTILIARKCKSVLPAWQLPQDKVLRLLFAASAIVLAITLGVSASTPPNNWDALSYHLTRQVYWAQQHSVANFPANDWRSLAMPPLAEFAGVHLMILSGGDRWASLIQWLAFGLTALAASAIARDLGCNTRLQAVAALLVLTIPAAVFQSMNSKNDLVVAFCLCALLFQALKMYQTKNTSCPQISLLAAAGGLLVLSKGTGMIFALPAVAWIAAMLFRQLPFQRALVAGALTAAIILAINFGHFLRSQREFGSPLGPTLKDSPMCVANRLHTAPAFVSNLARNTAMHLATPSTNLNAMVEQGVSVLHRWMNIDENHPLTTFSFSLPFAVVPNYHGENRVKAPVHLLLAIGALLPIGWNLFRIRDRLLAAFPLIPYAGFVLFCCLLAWQHWHSRLHIPLFALAAPMIAYGFGKFPRVLSVGSVLAFGFAFFSLCTMDSKPLVGKTSFLKRSKSRLRYYRLEGTRPGLGALRALCRQQKPKAVGIYAEANRCEYLLLWNLLQDDFPPPQLVPMNVDVGEHRPSPLPQPEIVATWYSDPGATNAVFSQNYILFTNVPPVQIYIKRSASYDPKGS